jgi:hypothetical protein
MHTVATPESDVAAALLTVRTAVVLQLPLAYVIVAVPAATPVATPVVDEIVATVVVLLVHAPPDTELESDVADNRHTDKAPVIAPGCAFTVTTFVTGDPHQIPYDIVAVPAEIPVTTPEVASIVATVGLALVHVPVLVVLVNVVVPPSHTVAVPAIAATVPTTVTVFVAVGVHPVLYRILTLPAATPVTIPVVKPTVALVGVPLDHVPPEVPSASVIVVPTHTIVGEPVIG